MQFLMHWEVFLIFLLSAPELAVPVSSAKITDLDQMVALVLSGLFVLLFSVRDLISQEHGQISYVSQTVTVLLNGLGGALVEAVGRIRRRSRGRNIATNF
jgi:asparagine N-glycosylation enzyme membrane subunit Stt3